MGERREGGKSLGRMYGYWSLMQLSGYDDRAIGVCDSRAEKAREGK